MGGKARALSLSPERRSEISRIAANKRWGNKELFIMTNEKHIVIKDGQGKCLHCGDCHPFKTPMLIDDFVKEAQQFIKRHAYCPPPEKDLLEKGLTRISLLS